MAEIDGLRASYPKTVLVIFRRSIHGVRRWEIRSRRGNIQESEQMAGNFLGFWAKIQGFESY